jgi:hypothetical protein
MEQNGLTTRNYFSLCILAAAYILFNFRYMPGQVSRSLGETAVQLLTTAPIPIGLTILVASFLKRIHDEPLPWDRIVRLYCMFGIITGFLYALNEYFERGAQALAP